MNDAIQLTIPAKPHMMLVARMALAGYCSQCGADVDTLEDIRTLCDESCYCLMHQARQAKALCITASREAEKVRIRFEAVKDAANARCKRLHDPEIARGILGTLAADVELKHDQGDMYAIEVAVYLGPL